MTRLDHAGLIYQWALALSRHADGAIAVLAADVCRACTFWAMHRDRPIAPGLWSTLLLRVAEVGRVRPVHTARLAAQLTAARQG